MPSDFIHLRLGGRDTCHAKVEDAGDGDEEGEPDRLQDQASNDDIFADINQIVVACASSRDSSAYYKLA